MPAQETDEVDWNNQDPATVIYKIGIYGWRKRCIYFLILLIMVVTIVNLSLVIWVMRVMDFNLVNIFYIPSQEHVNDTMLNEGCNFWDS